VTSSGAVAPAACDALRLQALSMAGKHIARWELAAAEGNFVRRFGKTAARLVNQTLSDFDNNARQRLGMDRGPVTLTPCAGEHEALRLELQRRLHSVFLAQRSAMERALHRRLKEDLLREMRLKCSDVDIQLKLRLLRAAVSDYESQAHELRPYFVEDDFERGHAQMRLSQVQWGIDDSPEALEMKQRWKIGRERRMPLRTFKRGASVSLSPGLRLMLRPQGLGNLQISSRWLVGPPHNPSEVSIGVANDGSISDVYNRKPRPPLLKLQPTIGVQVDIV